MSTILENDSTMEYSVHTNKQQLFLIRFLSEVPAFAGMTHNKKEVPLSEQRAFKR